MSMLSSVVSTKTERPFHPREFSDRFNKLLDTHPTRKGQNQFVLIGKSFNHGKCLDICNAIAPINQKMGEPACASRRRPEAKPTTGSAIHHHVENVWNTPKLPVDCRMNWYPLSNQLHRIREHPVKTPPEGTHILYSSGNTTKLPGRTRRLAPMMGSTKHDAVPLCVASALLSRQREHHHGRSWKTTICTTKSKRSVPRENQEHLENLHRNVRQNRKNEQRSRTRSRGTHRVTRDLFHNRGTGTTKSTNITSA